MEVFFLNEFDIEIVRFMVDCTAKGLSIKTLKSYERSYMRSLEGRGKYELNVNDNASNNPKVRDNFGKKISNTTIVNYTRIVKVFFAY